MADLFFSVRTPEVACYNNGVKRSVLQILAPANRRIKVLGWGVSFDGVQVAGEPVQVSLVKQLDALGGGTGVTPIKMRPVAETVQTTAAYLAASEPTDIETIDTFEVHPQSGYEVRYPYGQEIVVAGGSRLTIVVLSTSVVNVIAKLFCEE